jgi:crotonobetainyl-CoA:carnitine CoA-transferase CaiB-like acyl-CoA transferase
MAPDAAGVPVGPLVGVVVADFSRVLAGPYATMMLADMGATVIKVERPPDGDDTRAWGPPWSDGVSTYFQAVNRNKRSVACDLATPEGLATARALCRRADVVVENFRVGTMDRLGLGFAETRRVNPGVVYCAITGFGPQDGADLPGYDFLIQAMGGLMSITGYADGEPTKVGVAVVDVITGLHALAGILAALRHRERTGQGQRIDVNLLASLLSGLVNQVSGFLNAGAVPGRMGNRHPSIAPYELFHAADRPLALAVGNDRQFVALVSELGIGHLAADPRFATNAGRVTHRDRLRALLDEALGRADAAEWVRRLGARGVPCGPVNRVDEAVELATRLGLEPCVDLTDSDGRVSRQVRHPITFSATPATYHTAPPTRSQVHPAQELPSLLPPERAGGTTA